MIDHYILLGFLIALILQKIESNSLKKFVFATITTLCIGLNFAQAYQIRYGILTGGSATADQYWDNFLIFEKRAQVYPHSHWILEESQELKLSPKDSALIKGKSYFIEDIWLIQVTDYDNYSASVQPALNNLRKGSKIIVEFQARARHIIEETRVVMDLDGERHVFNLSPYLKKDEWVKIQYLTEPQTEIANPIILYFWNGGSEEKVEFKNILFRHYFSDDYL